MGQYTRSTMPRTILSIVHFTSPNQFNKYGCIVWQVLHIQSTGSRGAQLRISRSDLLGSVGCLLSRPSFAPRRMAEVWAAIFDQNAHQELEGVSAYKQTLQGPW